VFAAAKGEANLVALQVQQTMVGDGHAVGIAAQITQGLLRAAKGGLGVDHPLLLAQSSDESIEGTGRLQVEGGAGEA